MFCTKTFYTQDFVRNTYKFYNFLGNNYPQRNYLPIKNLIKNSKNNFFVTKFYNKF